METIKMPYLDLFFITGEKLHPTAVRDQARAQGQLKSGEEHELCHRVSVTVYLHLVALEGMAPVENFGLWQILCFLENI